MHHHYLLNKPHSYLSQFTNRHTTRRNKKMLGELHSFAPGTMSIGRLDENSEGLLLLTTDGKVSFAVAGGKKVEKEYYAQVLGVVRQPALERLNEGVEIGFNGKRYQTLPCQTRLLDPPPEFSFPPRRVHHHSHGPTSWVSVTLREGKYRQVRKMCAAVGHPVIRLIRVRIGHLQLGSMAAGEVVEVDNLGF